MIWSTFQPGDRVVYRVPKFSRRPGPRAKNIHPAPNGDTYAYEVDKYWIVADLQEGQLVLKTRRGKRRVVSQTDERLRKASLIERLLKGHRFPQQSS